MFLPKGKELRGEFSPEKWRLGGEYWRAGLVQDMVQGRGVWQATVIGITGSHRVRIRVRGRSLTVVCSCLEEYCQHAAAVIWGWSVAPQNFSRVDQLLTKVKTLSEDQILEILDQLALEEGALLERLLAGKEREKQKLSGESLLCLVNTLDFQSVSPWAKQQLLAEKYRSILRMIQVTIDEGAPEVGTALLSLINRTRELLLALPEGKSFLLPLFFEASDLFICHSFPDLNEEIIKELIEAYLKLILEDSEEEKFHQLFFTFLEKGEVERREFISLLSIPEKKEKLDLFGLKKIRLIGSILINFKEEEELDKFIQWCNSQLIMVLVLLDLLAENEWYEKAKMVIKIALSRFSSDNQRFVLRYRLAQMHRKLGEEREALFLELLNFEERPGKTEFFSLKELAMRVGEWNSVKKRLFHCLKIKKPQLYPELIAEEGIYR